MTVSAKAIDHERAKLAQMGIVAYYRRWKRLERLFTLDRLNDIGWEVRDEKARQLRDMLRRLRAIRAALREYVDANRNGGGNYNGMVSGNG